MKDPIERQDAIDAINGCMDIYVNNLQTMIYKADAHKALTDLPSAEQETHDKRTETRAFDLIRRQAAIEAITNYAKFLWDKFHETCNLAGMIEAIEGVPSAEPKQRYTEEELSVFAHGISLSLLSKRSAQHWRYDEDTATEIKFLERLYEKVGADIRGEEV